MIIASLNKFIYRQLLSQVVTDDSVAVWRQLERDLLHMKDLIARRAASIDQVDQLGNKNAELKLLLNQYLGDVGTNRCFQVPPAMVMRVKGSTSEVPTFPEKRALYNVDAKKKTKVNSRTNGRLGSTG